MKRVHCIRRAAFDPKHSDRRTFSGNCDRHTGTAIISAQYQAEVRLISGPDALPQDAGNPHDAAERSTAEAVRTDGWPPCLGIDLDSGMPAGVQLLRVTLDAGGIRGQVDEYVKDGGRLLPAIMHDGYGAYIKDPEQQTHIAAILVRGKARLLVDLGQGSTSRDSAGDMVAFMKLIAPKLLADTGTPSLSPSQKTGS
ncbi:hypothetical protein ACGFJC_42390 [Nonomuraea fuscirosea]|uniref:hypothetical protein n=1 Tax=Nonomuraea fuscirosea TaxID=1291556 RepID=UPI0034848EAE